VAGDRAGNGSFLEGHEDEILLGVLNCLADCFGNLVRLAEPHPDVATPVPHHDEGGEGEPSATFDDLGHPIDGHHPVVQLQHARIDPRFCHSILPGPVCF
jgi:hypothetical protein